MNTNNIILHSDDLGITEQSSDHIIDAWRSGDITSFSIIANGDAIKKIPSYLNGCPELGARIAVHFNLTEGYPSADPLEVPLLIGADGKFNQSFGRLLICNFFTHHGKRSELLKQIYKECKAQIGVVRALCPDRDLVAIDSHNHIHMIPGVFQVVASAARDEKIKQIRISKEPFFKTDFFLDVLKPFWLINLVKHLLLKVFSINASKIASKLDLHSPVAFIGLLYSGRMTAKIAMSGIRAVKSGGPIEVTFHVGRSAPNEKLRWAHNLYSEFHLSPHREIEREEVRKLARLLALKKQSDD
jgi:predicted glycoside hydrolase/deacetylase ChbG (UPF0249 family)